MEFEDILEDVGSYGSFQKNLVLLFTAPIAILAPFYSMALIFIVSVPEHWCKVPHLMSSNLSLNQVQTLMPSPEDPECHVISLNHSGTENVSFTCPNGWEYDKEYFESTASTQWNMVCDHSHYPSLILTLQNVGGLIGSPIYGCMADRVGRKVTLFIAIAVTVMTEIFSIVTSSFLLFAVLKTISGFIFPTMVILPQMLALELVRPDKRLLCSGVINTCWMIGMCILPLVTYLSRSWITLGIVNSITGAAIFLYWKYIPESPVWLISRERYDEALDIMIRISKKNKEAFDRDALMKKLKVLGEKVKAQKEEDKQSYCMYISKYPRLRKNFFIITFCWIANVITYTGLQYNVAYLEGNEFLNFFLLSVVEAPGNALFWASMERFGRRWSATFGFFLATLACFSPLTGLPHSETVSSVIGKLIISGVFIVTDQQAFELFPTVYRSFAIGISKTIVKATMLLVPYLVYLGTYGKTIPYIVMGILCLLAGLSAAFLPESSEENLPQNISDAEEFGRNQKFFSLNRKSKTSDSKCDSRQKVEVPVT